MRRLGPIVCALLLAGALDAPAQPRTERGSRTRGLTGGWGHSWRLGVPGWGKTRSHVAFVAFHPRLGWFVTDRLELGGEATLLAYYEPRPAVSAGLAGIAGRFHLTKTRAWTPYATAGAGLLWTSLDAPEIDRVFNFQLFYGVGVRRVGRRNPGWILELRNHHISNAGTAGPNLGLNAATLVAGVEWIVR
jgi:hypothetical protein